jgi:hypothetical protein
VIDSLHIVAVVLFLGGAAVGVFAWRQATTPRMRTYAGGSAVFVSSSAFMPRRQVGSGA